jgi:hypothetical protein
MSLAHSRPKKLYNCLFKSGWKLHQIVLKKAPRWPSTKIRWSSVIFAWKWCFIKKSPRTISIWFRSRKLKNMILFTFYRTDQKIMKTIIQRKHLWIFSATPDQVFWVPAVNNPIWNTMCFSPSGILGFRKEYRRRKR